MENKITFLCLHLGYGGIESSTINKVNALVKRNYNVEIISFYNLKDNQASKVSPKVKIKYLYNGEPNREEFKEAIKNFKIIKAFKEAFKALDILFKKRYLLIKEIKKSSSKIIVSTRYTFSILLSKYKNKDAIAIAEEHHHHNNNKKYINILRKKYTNIDYLFALTASLQKDYTQFLKDNSKTQIVLMPNMLHYIPTKKSKLQEKNLITVGRLHPVKRFNELIEIFSKLKNVQKLYIVGDGEEYKNLELQIKELNLEDRVILTGFRNQKEIGEYMLKSSIFVMTSITEGLPMVLLEAMSYGLPCIAYNLESGIKDIIDDNINGYIINNRDSLEYAKKVDYLINNQKKLEQMGLQAIKKAQEFEEDNVIKRWQKIIDKYIKEG